MGDPYYFIDDLFTTPQELSGQWTTSVKLSMFCLQQAILTIGAWGVIAVFLAAFVDPNHSSEWALYLGGAAVALPIWLAMRAWKIFIRDKKMVALTTMEKVTLVFSLTPVVFTIIFSTYLWIIVCKLIFSGNLFR